MTSTEQQVREITDELVGWSDDMGCLPKHREEAVQALLSLIEQRVAKYQNIEAALEQAVSKGNPIADYHCEELLETLKENNDV